MSPELLPLIERKANLIESRIRRNVRLGVPIFFGLALGGVIYYEAKKRAVENEIKKLATDSNVQNAALYVEAVKPPGLLMKLLSVGPIGVALKGADFIAGFFGLSEKDKILAITDRVWDWDKTVTSYRILTVGRSLNRDIKKKLGGDYPEFVQRLGNNTKAKDSKNGQQRQDIETQAGSDKDRDKVMQWPPGVIKKVPSDSPILKWKISSKKDNVILYSEPAHKKVAKVAKAGTYVGTPSGRFMNYKQKNAMVELITANGRAWGEWSEFTIWKPV